MTYDNDKKSIDLGDAFDMFFRSTDPVNCPITACKLMSQGCDSDYLGRYMTMKQSAPWTMTTQLNRAVGYSETVCIKCSNSAASISHDNFVVTQARNDGAGFLWMFIVLAGLFLAIVIIMLACCYMKHLEDRANIKWRREHMEKKLQQIDKAPKRSRRNTMTSHPSSTFTDLGRIRNDDKDMDSNYKNPKKRNSMYVRHDLGAGGVKSPPRKQARTNADLMGTAAVGGVAAVAAGPRRASLRASRSGGGLAATQSHQMNGGPSPGDESLEDGGYGSRRALLRKESKLEEDRGIRDSLSA